MKKLWILLWILGLLSACQPAQDHNITDMEARKDTMNTFGHDLQFLQKHLDDLILLKDEEGRAQVVVSPQYQGRVMTSTSGGEEGQSYGWINYELIASGELKEHMNPYGGEDRFWMGPEGGQYAIFFDEGDEFVFEDWQTPPAIDTEAFEVVTSNAKEAIFTKTIHLQNYSSTSFDVRVDRTIRLLNTNEMEKELGVALPEEGINYVAFASDNRISNQGEKAWVKEDGLLSIWILGMFKHSPTTTVVIPYNNDPGLDVPVVNDSYFGKVPEERLKVENGFIYFKGDGAYRSKIGVSPERAKPVMGSYDAENGVLTIVKFSLPQGSSDYVNSMWEIQNDPYGGDAINAYNDGSLENGSEQLGPFYEMESSSPAAALAPGASIQHSHITVHFSGSVETLDQLAREILGVGINQIKRIFSS
jgi:hypothetical protein